MGQAEQGGTHWLIGSWSSRDQAVTVSGMETPGLPAPLSTLAEDLLLLSFRVRGGRLGTEQRIDFGLAGAQLVQLAALGRVTITGGRVQVADGMSTGDPELDAALADLSRAAQPPLAQDWVGQPWSGIRAAYLSRLTAAGALRAEPGGVLGRTRWRIADQERAARARARLDAIAGSGGAVAEADAALGGLAHAIRLDKLLYPGRRGQQLRERLAAVAAGPRRTGVPQPAVPLPRLSGEVIAETGLAVAGAASHAAARAATAAAHQAGEHAAHADAGHMTAGHLHFHG
jgi:Golgi phosphoprotein 3 (GPP34)